VSLYETLGTWPNASHEDLRAAYRRLASKHHPDRKDGDVAKFQEIQKAWRILGDPKTRKRYDDTGDESDADDRPPELIEQERNLVLERKARADLIELMKKALQEDERDCVAYVRRHLEQVKANAMQMLNQGKEAEHKLTKRRGKIKVRKGENLMHAIIDDTLRNIRKQRAELSELLALRLEVLRQLEHYTEEQDPPPPAFQGFQIQRPMGAPQDGYWSGPFGGG
jgi:curved DNA-binding protein CbpA